MSMLSDTWEKIPQRLQQAIALALGVGLVLCMLMALWLVWGSGYFQERLGIPLTKQDLTEQTEHLEDAQGALVQETVDAAIAAYDANLQTYLLDKEEEARQTILQPILKGMQALERNQQQLMRSQTSTNATVQDMPAVFDRKLDALIQETDRSEERRRERELLEELLRRAQERDEEGAEPELPEKKRSKIKL